MSISYSSKESSSDENNSEIFNPSSFRFKILSILLISATTLLLSTKQNLGSAEAADINEAGISIVVEYSIDSLPDYYTKETLTPADFAHLLHDCLLSKKTKQRIRDALPEMTIDQIVILANELLKSIKEAEELKKQYRNFQK